MFDNIYDTCELFSILESRNCNIQTVQYEYEVLMILQLKILILRKWSITNYTGFI